MNTSLKRLSLILVLWALAATVAGAFRLLAHIPPAGAGILIACLVIAFYLAVTKSAFLDGAAAVLGARRIVAFHLGRFLGFYFLWLHVQGRIPVEFAQRAGWGDVLAAAGALALLMVPGPAFARLLPVWNWIGLADLVVAVGTASWLGRTRPGSVIELAVLPLALVPLFLVPVLMTSHLVLLRPARSA